MNLNRTIVGIVLAILLAISSLFGTVGAQSYDAVSQRVWENDRMRIVRLSLRPGERFTDESSEGSAIIFMGADLDGRIPPAEAAWREPGAGALENRGHGRFEALVVDLKSTLPRLSGVTPPEVIRALDTVTPQASRREYGAYGAGTSEAQSLIRNDRLSVTKERYETGQYWSSDPEHFHPQDIAVVYLRGGYIWPTSGFYAPERVRRGDVRIVPANVLHTPGNAGSDPLEFLLIVPA